MSNYKLPHPDDMDPDWGCDPDVDEHFPDDATIARDLEEDRRRLLVPRAWDSGSMWPMIMVALILGWLVWSQVSWHLERREWVRLVQGGGGEVHHFIAEARCHARPLLPRKRNLGIWVPIGATVEVVARSGDWALVDRYGRPCWAPAWALSRTAPDMRALRKCGRSCHPREPAGWTAAQWRAACRYDLAQRLRCAIEGLIAG